MILNPKFFPESQSVSTDAMLKMASDLAEASEVPKIAREMLRKVCLRLAARMHSEGMLTEAASCDLGLVAEVMAEEVEGGGNV